MARVHVALGCGIGCRRRALCVLWFILTASDSKLKRINQDKSSAFWVSIEDEVNSSLQCVECSRAKSFTSTSHVNVSCLRPTVWRLTVYAISVSVHTPRQVVIIRACSSHPPRRRWGPSTSRCHRRRVASAHVRRRRHYALRAGRPLSVVQ